MAAGPEPARKVAVCPEPARNVAAGPEPAREVAASQEHCRKVADSPKSIRKMPTSSEPPAIIAASAVVPGPVVPEVSIPEVLPLESALPVVVAALLCVWVCAVHLHQRLFLNQLSSLPHPRCSHLSSLHRPRWPLLRFLPTGLPALLAPPSLPDQPAPLLHA